MSEGVSVDVSALGSISLSLEEIIERLRDLSQDLDDDDEIGSELKEVERQLHMAWRRLDKAMRRATA